MGHSESFTKLLAWAYRGEVSGQELFAGLAATFTDHDHRAKLDALAALEREMAQALEPVLERYGVDRGDDDRSRERGRDNAAGVAALGWSRFLEQFGPVTDAALDRYRTLAALAPDDDPVFDLLIAHEVALQEFANAELGDRGGDALEMVDDVRRHLAGLR
jgi:hypothetical protein